MTTQKTDTLIIGAGLTGLSCATLLRRAGKEVTIIEADSRIGGQINTLSQNGFIYETGPNTGSLSTPEVAELFELLADDTFSPETASAEANARLIWQGKSFRPLPSSLVSAITTPLFTFADKLRILGEPWRRRGANPNESVADLVRRRLGKSFLDYAVDPFLGGVYAGDPEQLVTRFALPKLYALEQRHGSFIRGAMALGKQPKSERDKKATKKVFSARQGLITLVHRMAAVIGPEHILTEARATAIAFRADSSPRFTVTYTDAQGQAMEMVANQVVTTVPAHVLCQLLPQVAPDKLSAIKRLYYAPIIEVAVGFKQIKPYKYKAFGGLVPSCEQRGILGILFPSDCFQGRAPQGGALYTIFMGGVKHPELMAKSDEEISALALHELYEMLEMDSTVKPDLLHISRYPKAIAQYYADSQERFEQIAHLQQSYPGLYIGGSMIDGIGMAHRITQATNIANIINSQP